MQLRHCYLQLLRQLALLHLQLLELHSLRTCLLLRLLLPLPCMLNLPVGLFNCVAVGLFNCRDFLLCAPCRQHTPRTPRIALARRRLAPMALALGVCTLIRLSGFSTQIINNHGATAPGPLTRPRLRHHSRRPSRRHRRRSRRRHRARRRPRRQRPPRRRRLRRHSRRHRRTPRRRRRRRRRRRCGGRRCRHRRRRCRRGGRRCRHKRGRLLQIRVRRQRRLATPVPQPGPLEPAVGRRESEGAHAHTYAQVQDVGMG